MKLQDLPSELLLDVFEHCSDFEDAIALSCTTKSIYQLLQCNKSSIYLAIAPSRLQAFGMADALATAQKQGGHLAGPLNSARPRTIRDERALILQMNARIVSSAADELEQVIYMNRLDVRRLVLQVPKNLSYTERTRLKGILYQMWTMTILTAQEDEDRQLTRLKGMSGIEFLQLEAALELLNDNLRARSVPAIQGGNYQQCWSLLKVIKGQELSQQRQLVCKYYEQLRLSYRNSSPLEPFAILDLYQDELHLIAKSVSAKNQSLLALE